MTFHDFFQLGMKRTIPPLRPMPTEGIVLNLGAGFSPIPCTLALDYPEWNAERQPIPYADGEVSGIHAYHFLEHFADPKLILREMQRVLKPGGIAQIVVPHYRSAMASHDLDHKSWFTEDTWRQTFHNPYYAKGHAGWQFEIGFNVVAGIVERNLCLMTQLIRL